MVTAVSEEKEAGTERATHLLDHIERKLQALALEHGDQVSEQDREVLVAVPEGDEDRHLEPSTAEQVTQPVPALLLRSGHPHRRAGRPRGAGRPPGSS